MIENRPISEFEVDCIIESQKRLREDEIYMKLQKEIDEANKNLTAEQEKNIFMNYEYGFFNGEMFALVKMEKLREFASKDENL